MARVRGGKGADGAEKAATYRGSLSLLATLVMCFTFLCVVLLERPAVGAALRTLAAAPGNLSQTSITTLAQLLVVPLVCALVAYVVAAQAVSLLRIALYRNHLHRYAEHWLRTYAPLRAAGIRLTGTRHDPDGTAQAATKLPLDSASVATLSLLLLGGAGAGKTTALHILAFELTRRRKLIPLYLRRAPLPILLSAATFDGEAVFGAKGFLRLLQRQVGTFGTKGLAARLPRMVRRGRIVVLCDGLDELPALDRKQIGDALAGLLMGYTKHTTAIVSCDLRIYEEELRTLAPLKALERVVINEIATDEACEALRRRTSSGGSRRLTASDTRGALESHRLMESIRTPAGLAALMALNQGGETWPYGRGELLRSYARALCGGGAGERPDADRKALLLGALAVSLRVAGTRTLKIPRARSMGRVMVEWLDETPPLAPTELKLESHLIASPEEAESACQDALARGILLRTPDGAGIAFANSVLEATFAAWWLDLLDDGMGRLNAELLQGGWTLPVMLWLGAQRNPADLAARLY
ncbi:MAG: hypothetical protein ACRDHP_20275, partial [Ktedonobacterales bacterium]